MLKGLSGQVILCTKEVSVGARKNAFALLVEMGHAFLRFGPNKEGTAWMTQGRDGCLAHGPLGGTPPNHWLRTWAGRTSLARIPSPRGPACSMQSALPGCDYPYLAFQRPCNATSSWCTLASWAL